MFCGAFMGQAQQKNYINYQGVARNSDNELMEQETIDIGIALKFGSADAVAQYEESHSITTDANGVFNLQIGSGNSNSGSYSNLPWGQATFVVVSFNGVEVGTTELMAVPYAMASGSQQWETNGNNIENKNVGEVKIKSDLRVLGGFNLNSGNQVNEISDDGGLAENSNGILPTQRAVKTYVDNRLFSGGGGGDAQIASEVPYNNADSGLTAGNVQEALDEIVATAGGGADADADPTNELQDISLSGTDLSITDGSTIDLSAIIPPGGTDDQNASEVPFDNTGTGLAAGDTQAAIEELATGGLVDTDDQALVMTGDVLSIEDGTGSVDLNDYVDITGESGLLLGDGTNISGLEGTADGQVAKWDGATSKWVAGTDEVGGAGGSSLWSESGDDIYFDSGNVGVGLTDPSAIHHVHADSYQSNSLYTTDDSGNASNDGMYVGLVNDLGLGFTATITNQEDGPLILGTNGTNRVIITKDGNVGIGTNTPNVKLHLKSNSTIDKPLLKLEEEGDDFSRLEFRNTVSDAFWQIAGIAKDGIGGAANSRLNFYIQNNQGAANRMTISGSGNVGIGNENPSEKLEVAGNIKTTGEIHSKDTGNANMLAIAYGAINSNGEISSGSDNFSITRTAVGKYSIQITGESYILWDYPTLVSRTRIGFIESGSVGGKLLVDTFNTAGVAEDAIFSFVVYKP